VGFTAVSHIHRPDPTEWKQCSYDVRVSSPSSRLFQMLLDLGVSPASVSEQRAAWVFDDVVRNGLRDPGVCIRPTQQALRRNSNGHETRHGEPLVGIGNGKRGGRHSRSRKQPRGDRLCWSLFLEAMVSISALVQTTLWLNPRCPLSFLLYLQAGNYITVW